jgi:hypothetical protein
LRAPWLLLNHGTGGPDFGWGDGRFRMAVPEESPQQTRINQNNTGEEKKRLRPFDDSDVPEDRISVECFIYPIELVK